MQPRLFVAVETYPIFLVAQLPGRPSVAWSSFRRVGMSSHGCWLMLSSLPVGGLLGAKGYAVFENPDDLRSLLEPTHGVPVPWGDHRVRLGPGLLRKTARSRATVGDALMPAVAGPPLIDPTLRTGQFKYVRWANGKDQLYDLQKVRAGCAILHHKQNRWGTFAGRWTSICDRY